MSMPEQVETAIGDRIARILERIERACVRAGRRPDAVTLIAVTKTFPVEVVHAAYEAGVRHFGENRVQELVTKSASVGGQLQGGAVQWHMIGHIQRNKAREVVNCADLVHSLDSLRLAASLNERAAAAGRLLPCLIQVNVSGEDSKFGLQPEDVPEFVEKARQYDQLRLEGFMTLASPASDPERVRPEFRRLRSLRETAIVSNQLGPALSMGMSGDFEVAIEEGATHVRIGSALFGGRA